MKEENTLRTLKDLGTNQVVNELLKQEAIKDIKFLEKLPDFSNPKEDLDKVHKKNMEETHFALFDAIGCYDNSNVIAYIKWKNNLTEKDLK